MIEFFEKQKQLDNLILANFSKRIGKEVSHKQLVGKRFLALFVEIGEFSEEENREKKKEEYIDCFHFLLSIGNTLELNEILEKQPFNDIYMSARSKVFIRSKTCVVYYVSLIKFIINVSKLVNKSRVQKYWSVNHNVPDGKLEKAYNKAVMSFFNLGHAMGYTAEEIRLGYHSKWLINIKRQKEKY